MNDKKLHLTIPGEVKNRAVLEIIVFEAIKDDVEVDAIAFGVKLETEFKFQRLEAEIQRKKQIFENIIRGIALEGEKGRTVTLTPAAVEAIAESFGEWVAATESNGNGVIRVSLGRDTRVSGGKLSTAVFAGLARAGCLAFDMGLATTPACFMSTLLSPFEYDASIMVTKIVRKYH